MFPHDVPKTANGERMHVLDETCWCKPYTDVASDGLGIVLRHRKETLPLEPVKTILIEYSEWLDRSEIQDEDTHGDLVNVFLAQRNPHTPPALELA